MNTHLNNNLTLIAWAREINCHFLIISSEGSAYNRLISNSETQLSQCILQDLIQKFIMCLLEFTGKLMKVLLVALIQVLVNPWEMNEMGESLLLLSHMSALIWYFELNL